MDTTVVLGDAVEQATPAPHVWVSGEHLERMAAACGIEVTHREAWIPPPTSRKNVVVMVLGFVAVVGLFVTMSQFFGPTKGRRSNESCSQQRAPEQELYPRVSCQDARDREQRQRANRASRTMIEDVTQCPELVGARSPA